MGTIRWQDIVQELMSLVNDDLLMIEDSPDDWYERKRQATEQAKALLEKNPKREEYLLTTTPTVRYRVELNRGMATLHQQNIFAIDHEVAKRIIEFWEHVSQDKTNPHSYRGKTYIDEIPYTVEYIPEINSLRNFTITYGAAERTIAMGTGVMRRLVDALHGNTDRLVPVEESDR